MSDTRGDDPEKKKHFDISLVQIRPRLMAYAKKLTRGDEDEAENLVQDTLLKAYKARSRFVLGTNLWAWTTTIMTHTRATKMTSAGQRRTVRGEVADAAIEGASTLANQESALTLKETAEYLDRLAPKLRNVLELVAIKGFSYDEAAAELNIPVGTIKSSLSRARERIIKMRDEGPRRAPKEQ